MGRKRRGNPVGGILVLGVIALAYWQYVLGFAVVWLIGYIIVKAVNRKPAPANTVTGVTFSLNSIALDSSRRRIPDKIKFHSSLSSMKVCGFQFEAKLLYTGSSPLQLPHLVRTDLPVGVASSSYLTHMGYWPSYESISLNDKATYLQWLASGRRAPEADIGLVFLYFYGLEYRAIFEGQNHSEIYQETLQLLELYGEKSGSFLSYASGFLAWLILKNPDWNKSIAENLRSLLETKFKAGRYLTVLQSRSTELMIDQHWVYECARQEFGSQIGAYMTYASKEFKALFLKKLEGKLPKATDISVVPIKWSYSTATSLRPSGELEYQGLGISKSYISSTLKPIWNSCISELDAYTAERKKGHPFAILRLPIELHEEFGRRKLSLVQDFVNSPHDQPLTVKKACRIIGTTFPGRTNIKWSREFKHSWSLAGFNVEPDPDLSDRGYKADDSVVLFTEAVNFVDKNRYSKATLFMDLCASVSTPDDTKDSSGWLDSVSDLISKQLFLNENEQTRLRHRAKLLAEGSLANSGVAKKLGAQLKATELQSLARFLTTIAGRYGTLDQHQVKSLERTFKSFGLYGGILNTIVDDLNVGAQRLVILKSSKATKSGSQIPTLALPEQKQAIHLSTDALKRAFSEAAELSQILSRVFTEEDPSEIESKGGKGNAQDPEAKELKKSEYTLLDWLTVTERRPISEVEAKCRSLGLMYGAAIERINSWSESKYGDAMLEEDDSELVVNSGLKEKEPKSA